MRPTVQATPHAGVYSQSVVFRIETEPGVTYYYTLDGSLPDTESAVYHGAAFPVQQRQVLYPRHCAGGLTTCLPRLYEYTYDLTGYHPAVSAGAVTEPGTAHLSLLRAQLYGLMTKTGGILKKDAA